MEPKDLLAAMRAAWWLPLVGLVVGGGVALGITLLQTPVYSSTTQFFVSTGGSTIQQALQGSQLAEQRAESYVRLLETRDVAQRVVDRLGLDVTAGQLREEIRASSAAGTVVIEVTVTDPSPRRAQDIAQAIGDDFPEYVSRLETQGATDGASPVQVAVTDRAGLPTSPISPDPVRNIALGLVAGLVVGVGVALARKHLVRSVPEDQVTEALGAPVVGWVLRDEKLAEKHVLAPGAATGEGFGQLRDNLQWLNVDSPPRVMMLAGVAPAQGTTTTLLNLAQALADVGHKVVVVDADLRTRMATQYLGLSGEVGLTSVLAGTAELAEALQRIDDRDLVVLPAGPQPPNPGELLATTQMSAILDKLRGEYDFVLLDAPPVLQVADASRLAGCVDGVLLAVRYGRIRPEQLRRAAESLEQATATTLGAIVTVAPPKARPAASRDLAPASA